jgi:hypothetical protein
MTPDFGHGNQMAQNFMRNIMTHQDQILARLKSPPSAGPPQIPTLTENCLDDSVDATLKELTHLNVENEGKERRLLETMKLWLEMKDDDEYLSSKDEYKKVKVERGKLEAKRDKLRRKNDKNGIYKSKCTEE